MASAAFDGDGRAEILTGVAAGSPHYRVVPGNATGVLPPTLFEAIAPDIQGGVLVGV